MITPYVFLIRYYNGKHKSYLSEFINGLYNLSKNLSLNQNFESYDMAVKSVELCIQEVINNFRTLIMSTLNTEMIIMFYIILVFSMKCSKVFKKVLNL